MKKINCAKVFMQHSPQKSEGLVMKCKNSYRKMSAVFGDLEGEAQRGLHYDCFVL